MNQVFTKKEYEKYVKKKSPNSPIFKNVTKAFIIGGFICLIGQFVSNYFKGRGMSTEHVGGATAIVMVLIGALLTGFNIYDDIAKHAGAGTLIPITGFANAIVSPAIEFKREGYILGVASKMFVIAGPVLVYGVITSIAAGIVYFFVILK